MQDAEDNANGNIKTLGQRPILKTVRYNPNYRYIFSIHPFRATDILP